MGGEKFTDFDGMDTRRHPLFAYGTLMDTEIRRRVLGAQLDATTASLPDFELLAADGFYFARARPGSSVRGVVLVVDDDQLARADAWEEVPIYHRLRTEVELEGGERIKAWVYVREDTHGEPVSAPGIAGISRAAVIAMLDETS
jgi:gamma-glutamylcyclotransferase (GGCT)/AIG2-like uncharacterized protein YtfP